MVKKHRAQALVNAATALEEYERVVHQVAEKRERVERAVFEANKYFKPSIVASVLGRPTGWVVARRDGKRWPRLDREQQGPSS